VDKWNLFLVTKIPAVPAHLSPEQTIIVEKRVSAFQSSRRVKPLTDEDLAG
jgi:hypothetical protein